MQCKYTVIGYWTDNRQPFTLHVEAVCRLTAQIEARQALAASEFAEGSDDEGYLLAHEATRIVAVLDGHHIVHTVSQP